MSPGLEQRVAGHYPVPLFDEGDWTRRRRSSRAPWRHACRLANAALSSLNWLAGCRSSPVEPLRRGASTPESTDVHARVRARVWEAAEGAALEERQPSLLDASRETDEEALVRLLRGRGRYDVAAGVANNLAAFDPLLVPPPSNVRHAPEVATLVAPDEAPFLTDGSLMLRPEEERSEIRQSLTVPYVDPKLRSSRRLHTQLLFGSCWTGNYSE